ncbi:MAG TPA: lytic murein transglycosylase, partial [Xanthobacteraceae bacterium]|nr:lytic murein transglycosylase [Xanthobacteraceae bacterium]
MAIGSLGLRILWVAAIVTGATTGAAAQLPDLRSLFAPNPSTGAVPPPTPAPEWTGQDGASGHPLMTRDA